MVHEFTFSVNKANIIQPIAEEHYIRRAHCLFNKKPKSEKKKVLFRSCVKLREIKENTYIQVSEQNLNIIAKGN